MEGFFWMPRRALVVLIAIALASLGAVARPDTVVADDSLTIEEMCGLFPTDMGLSTRVEGDAACRGWRGSLATEEDEGTWLSGNIWAETSVVEARAEMDDSGVSTSWTPVSGLGDAAFEAYLSEYNMYVLRDRYILYVNAATNLTDEAKRLMAHLDRGLAAALAKDPVDSDIAGGSGGDTGQPGADRTIDYVGVFFGTTGLGEGLGNGLDVYGVCGGYAEDIEDIACPNNERVWNTIFDFMDAFSEEFESFSERDQRRVETLAMALGMTEMLGKDCKPLFPSLITAFPVIERLAIYGDGLYQPPGGEDPVPVAQRLVEVLAAQDAAGWEDRFPENHGSIDWPPCGDIDGEGN